MYESLCSHRTMKVLNFSADVSLALDWRKYFLCNQAAHKIEVFLGWYSVSTTCSSWESKIIFVKAFNLEVVGRCI